MATYFTTEKLGPKRSLTPEGFLLCEEVPIARTGMMIYGPNETPIEPGPDGYVKIFREPEDVFRPETVASYNGKSVTIDHPRDDVAPHNWKELEVGVCMNVRRGAGAMDDLLIGDFLIKDPEAIQLINEDDKREVSCGYEADYVEVEPGVGKQTNIIGNHIALVDQGRCGPRCAIGDRKSTQGETKVKKESTFDKLLKAFGVKDAAELQEKLSQDEGGEASVSGDPNGEQHIHLHLGGSGEPADTRVQDDDPLQAHIDQNAREHEEMRAEIAQLRSEIEALKGGEVGEEGAMDEETAELMRDEVPEGVSEEEIKTTKDSRFLADSFRDTVALAEILVPGIKFPTYDSAAAAKTTFKDMCAFRRNALDLAYATETRKLIGEALRGKAFDSKNMTCGAIRNLFNTVALAKKAANSQVHMTGMTARDTGTVKPAVATPADLNRRMAEIYNK